MGHMVSLATTQSCHCSAKVIMRYTIDMSAFNKTLLTEKIGGWIGSTDHILPNPGLHNKVYTPQLGI